MPRVQKRMMYQPLAVPRFNWTAWILGLVAAIALAMFIVWEMFGSMSG